MEKEIVQVPRFSMRDANHQNKKLEKTMKATHRAHHCLNYLGVMPVISAVA